MTRLLINTLLFIALAVLLAAAAVVTGIEKMFSAIQKFKGII